MIVCNFCSSEFPTEQSLLYHQKHTKYCISIQYLSSRLQDSMHNIIRQLETKITQLTDKYDQLKVKYVQLEESTNQQIIDLKLLLYTHLPTSPSSDDLSIDSRRESPRSVVDGQRPSDTPLGDHQDGCTRLGDSRIQSVVSPSQIFDISFKRFQKIFCEINPYRRV